MDYTQSSRLNLKEKILFLSLFFVIFLTMVQPGLCTMNVSDFGGAVGESLGFEGTDADTVGGMVLTSILFLMFFLPTAFLTRGKSVDALMIAGVLPLLLGIVLQWLDSWVLILVILISSGLFARAVSGIVR